MPLGFFSCFMLRLTCFVCLPFTASPAGFLCSVCFSSVQLLSSLLAFYLLAFSAPATDSSYINASLPTSDNSAFMNSLESGPKVQRTRPTKSLATFHMPALVVVALVRHLQFTAAINALLQQLELKKTKTQAEGASNGHLFINPMQINTPDDHWAG